MGQPYGGRRSDTDQKAAGMISPPERVLRGVFTLLGRVLKPFQGRVQDRRFSEDWETFWPRAKEGTAGLFGFLALLLRRTARSFAVVVALEASKAGLAGVATIVLSRFAGPLERGNFKEAIFFLWLFMLLRAIQLGAEFLCNYLRIALRTKLTCDLRQNLLERILRLPMTFYHRVYHGAIVQHVNVDVAMTVELVTTFLFAIMESLFVIVCIGAAVFYLDWRVALVAMICVMLSSPLVQVARRRVAAISKRLFSVHAQAFSLLERSLLGIKYVKSMGLEGQESRRLGTILLENRACEIRAATTNQSVSSLLEFCYLLVLCGAVSLFGSVLPDGLALSSLVPLLYGLFRLFPPIRKAVNMCVSFEQLRQAAERVHGAMTHESERTVRTERCAPVKLPLQNVAFRKVSFSYVKNRGCLHDVSFEIGRGELVAVIGESGSGKTTICDLMMGLYEEYAGEILIGGAELRTVDEKSYRSLLAYVPQEPLLIQGSIRQNLLYGAREELSDDALVTALGRANAAGFVEGLPEGLDAVVGDRGANLSGGERQRLCLARALLRDPQLLVLDEATSALDQENERILLDALSGLKKDMLVMFVSHRVQVLEFADRVLVVGEGLVREVGKPVASGVSRMGKG